MPPTTYVFLRQFSGHTNYVRALLAEGGLAVSGGSRDGARVERCDWQSASPQAAASTPPASRPGARADVRQRGTEAKGDGAQRLQRQHNAEWGPELKRRLELAEVQKEVAFCATRSCFYPQCIMLRTSSENFATMTLALIARWI